MTKRLLSILCLCLLLVSIFPVSAAADNAIEKVLCTTSTIPVAQASARDIYANTSTAGCYIEDYNWRDTSNGYYIYQSFPTNNVEVSITLRANDGWYFADNVAVYLNNSSAFFSIGEGGKTLTLTRTYSPELWLPNIIKNPGSETLDEGGMASFVASATVTSEYKWYIYDPANDKSYEYHEIPSLFEGASAQENSEGKLNIYNVPAAMDGWQVYCVFKGPGGEVKSAKANIKVKYETPPSTATPEPTPEPTPTPEATAESEEEFDINLGTATVHAHTFTAQWKHTDAVHWRECECGAKSDEAVHTMVWETTREPSKLQPGLKLGICERCGFESEKEIEYNSANSVVRYIVLGLGGLVLLTILILVADSIAASRRRRRRRKKRRR